MSYTLIDQLVGSIGVTPNCFTRKWVIRDLPNFEDKFYLIEIMDEMIKEVGGVEYSMEFLIYFKNRKKFNLGNDYKGISIKACPSSNNRALTLKPFLL